MPVKNDTRCIPWVTYTDPELAHIGLTEAQARNRARVQGVALARSRIMTVPRPNGARPA
jgi:pyruvate/2-oxoglutarate dehydrogenase complex dihydrolipoamide dehydrogenase (E3) component